MGYGCDIYETGPEPGGILRWGVPSYRLPQGVLREEIARIVEPGVRIHCGNTVGEEFFAQTASTYDVVFVACGTCEPGPASRGGRRDAETGSGEILPRPKAAAILSGGPAAMTVPGEDLPGIEDGLELLRKVAAGNAPALEGLVAVIGGGYAAVEVARCVVRLGAKALFVCTQGHTDMPASRQGIAMALEEGVEVVERMTPESIEAQGGEFLITLREDRTPAAQPKAAPIPAGGPAAPAALRVSRIFMAGGAWEPGPTSRSVEIIQACGDRRGDAAEQWMLPPEAGEGVIRLNYSVLVLSAAGPQPKSRQAAHVAFVGDLVCAPGSVAHAVASGKEAAMALDLLLREGSGAVRPGLKRCAVGPGRSLSFEAHMNGPRSRRSSRLVRYGDINTDYFQFSPRLTQPRLLKAERARSFAEIDLKISAGIAMREAERCFNCGICNECDNCRLFCPDLAVVRDLGQPPASRVGGRAVDILNAAPPPRGRYIDYDYCKGCGICVVECPRNAMTLQEEASFQDSD
jgi:NADPH-dependent glutamate synthase beta subunit-like oxidoreductase/Pyruvate/2-oxoacid:ferredoxin oxidoreductase delta subunit